MIAEEWSKNEVSERSKSNDESSKWAEEWSKSEVIERRKSNDESSKCSKCAQKMMWVFISIERRWIMVDDVSWWEIWLFFDEILDEQWNFFFGQQRTEIN